MKYKAKGARAWKLAGQDWAEWFTDRPVDHHLSLNSIKQRKMNIVGQSQQELEAVKTGAE